MKRNKQGKKKKYKMYYLRRKRTAGNLTFILEEVSRGLMGNGV